MGGFFCRKGSESVTYCHRLKFYHIDSFRLPVCIPWDTITMSDSVYQLEYYLTEEGVCPFTEWLYGLRDRVATSRIRTRLDRVSLGNFGTVESVGQGVSELKVDHGPGYRVYFAMSGKTIVLLLVGGDKSTQRKDIAAAHSYWKDFQTR